MTPRATTVGLVIAAAAWTVGAGCTESTLEERSLLKNRRVIGIVAEPPEVAPGETVRLSAVLVDADGALLADPGAAGLELRWSACLRAERVGALSGMQFEDEILPNGCGGADPRLVLPLVASGLGAEVTGAMSAQVAAIADLAGSLLGDRVPEDFVRRVVTTIGVPVFVEVAVADVTTGSVLLRAFKRVLVSPREGRGTNPPPARVEVAGAWLAAAPNDPFYRCAPESGELPSVARGSEVILRPADMEELWLETYPILDTAGRFVDAEENAYYSFFATAGELERGITMAPARENRWLAPTAPGTYPLWMVVRDGHGGTSPCRFEVVVP